MLRGAAHPRHARASGLPRVQVHHPRATSELAPAHLPSFASGV